MSESSGGKKRKSISDAERLALELAKLTPKHVHETRVRFENEKIVFAETSKISFYEKCTWNDDRVDPRYCCKAEFKFSASLPDRKFLTRFSVKCLRCYDDNITAVHMFCSHCDEILTGSIAGPGGKVTDRLITIRHAFQEAVAVNAYLEEQGFPQDIELLQAREYVMKLEEWSETVRYQKKSLKKPFFDDILRALRLKLSQVQAGIRNGLYIPA
jgi:hypothetical protein